MPLCPNMLQLQKDRLPLVRTVLRREHNLHGLLHVSDANIKQAAQPRYVRHME